MLNLFHNASLDDGYLDIFLNILSVFAIILGISVINSKNPIVSVLYLIGLFLSISLNLILIGYNFIGLSYLLVYVGAISILFLFILMLINIRISELINDTSNSMPLAAFTGFCFGFPFYYIFSNINPYSSAITSLSDKIYLNLDLNNLNFNNLISKTEQENTTSFTDGMSNLSSKEIIINNKEKSDFSYFTPGKNIDNSVLLDIVEKRNDFNDKQLYYVTSSSWDNNLIDLKDITSIGNVLYSTYGIWLIICSIILLLAMIGAITITKKEKD